MPSRPPIPIKITGPTGDQEKWTILFHECPKNLDGYCDFEKRIIGISSRLRNQRKIELKLLHEIHHATTGQNGSELYTLNLERNYKIALDAAFPREAK